MSVTVWNAAAFGTWTRFGFRLMYVPQMIFRAFIGSRSHHFQAHDTKLRVSRRTMIRTPTSVPTNKATANKLINSTPSTLPPHDASRVSDYCVALPRRRRAATTAAGACAGASMGESESGSAAHRQTHKHQLSRDPKRTTETKATYQPEQRPVAAAMWR